jgi:phosphoribosylformylglycinamidine (FGAM) synthase PurS component
MTVTPGVPAKLALVPATANTQAGAAVSYTATIQDANGNTVATATNSIGFSVSGVSGTFSPASPVAPTGGSATSSLTPTTTGTATVTVSASGLAVATAALTVTAGAPTKLVLLPTTATTQIGTAVNYAATIQDANGNTVAGATNPISFSVSGVSGTFGPASPVTPTGGSSTSSFTPTTTGTATITASAGGLTGATAGLTVLSGAPAKLGLVPAIAATQAGLTISYTAAIQDADGNTLTTATNAISFSVGGVSGTLSPASPVTPTGGTATSSFTPTTPGTATITASAAGLTSATASLTVIPGAPAKLALVPATGAAQAGAAVSYTATIQDANGNTISTSTSAVSFSVSGVSGTFSPASPVTPTSGSATSSFTPTTIGTGTITASASGLTSATAALTVTAGAPSKLALLPTTASVQSGTAVSYTATIQDANSNTVAGATNPISFSVSGVSGSFSPASPMAPANGTATSSLTPTAAGTATVTASAAGLTSASSTLTVSGSATPGATLVGDQVVRTGKDENPAGQAEAFSATAVASGTLTSLTVFVDATSTATQLTVGLYASSGTHPGTLLTQGTLNSPVAGTWNTVPVPNATVTSGTTYWIAVLGPVGAGILRFRDTTVGTAAETNSQSNLTALPGTWSTGSVYSNSPMSAYGSAASGPVLSVSPGTIAFSATAQGANPAPKSLSVSNPGTGTVNFTAAANQAWLTVTPSSGSAPQSLQLNASIAGLAAATYSGQVTITAAGAQGSPSVVTVTLTLTQPLGPPAKLVLVPAVAGTQTQSAVSYTATIQDANGATVATATNPISFAVSGVNGTFSPPSPVAPTAGRATTSMTPTTAGTASVTASAAGLTGASATLTVSTAPLQNDIYLENKKAGTPDVLYSLSSRYTSTVIAGYASAQSVNRGGTLDFRVSTSQPGTYSINVYRLGYYGGLGARLVTASGPLSGVTQPGCAVTDRATRLVECNWAKSYTLNLGADWTSGLYLAKLVHAATLKEHPIFFVVRNDGSTSNILVQSSRTTALAYGSYGTPTEHYSLYDYNSTNGTAALKVSLDRPSDEEDGFYNTLLRFEYQMARWLESQGYDVTYVTNIDVHSNAAQLLQHKIFLSVGHDEYWSKQMRDGVEAARDAGVNLGFFSANTAYWRVRFEPSSTGVPNRVMVCYKDPVAHPDPVEPTYRWRDPPNNRPENALLGVMYIGDHGDLFGGFNFIVSNASDPYYANTGLTNGAALSKLVGYEWDAVVNNGSTPPGLVVLGSSTVVPTTIAPGTPSTSTQISNAVRYTAPSGAQVFATGSIQWVWGLDSEGVSLARDDQRAQQFAVNILSSMGAKPVSPDPGIIVP